MVAWRASSPWDKSTCCGAGSQSQSCSKRSGYRQRIFWTKLQQRGPAAGHDVDACFDAAAEVSGQWLYRHAPAGTDPCRNVRSRLSQLREEEARVKLQLFTVKEILNPQPDAAAVVHALLAWIDEADKAAQP